MMISTKGRYALRLMIDIAEHQREGYIRLRDVAKRQGISEKYLEIIVRALVQQEYLTGVRGKGGGYRLSLEPEACSVRQILEAAEGPLVPVVCMSGAQECPRMEECPTLPLWRGLDRVISEYLDSFTLEDLLDHTAGAMQARVPAEGAGS
ncbi:MAG: RrF2 family transcriptional regulator [Oscillibacter sp.]|nr:RrF2 family transcriptional regulator [Oscillibacter sp.]